MEQKANKGPLPDGKIITIPNVLSFFRICLIPLIAWLYLSEGNSHWAGYMLLLSGVTDVVDGFIARTFHMTSDLGKILDPIADKLTQATMLICLMIRYPLMLAPLVLLVVKELFMAMSGLQVIRKTGVVPGANWHGKAATCLLYATMFLHIFWRELPAYVSTLSILACSAMVLLSFALYGIRNLKILRGNEAHL